MPGLLPDRTASVIKINEFGLYAKLPWMQILYRFFEDAPLPDVLSWYFAHRVWVNDFLSSFGDAVLGEDLLDEVISDTRYFFKSV
jgi:hypothetical protein